MKRRSSRAARKKKPESRKYAAVGAAAFVLIFATAVYAASSTYPDADIVTRTDFQKYPGALFDYEVTRYPAMASVTEFDPESEAVTIGVASETDAVNFGKVPAGGSYSTKFISLVNLRGEPAKVTIRARGDIAPYVTFDKNGIVLQPNQNATVEVRFLPNNIAVGDYTGDVEVAVKRAKDPILTNIW